MRKMRFVKTNLNPFGKKVGDCSVRAIAKATDKDWFEIYEPLCKIGKTLCVMPNDLEALKFYLNEFPYTSCKAIKGKKREIVSDFEKGTYVLRIANHFTAVKDGVCYDLWDCRKKCVYCYWEIKRGE
jgi:hypothetical protein